MKAPVSPQLKIGVSGQTQTYDTALPYLHVDNPTNARIRFDNGMTVGPYTLNAVISLPSTTGSYSVDTSDISYPNVGIFTNAQISTWLTDEERPQPGVSYAPTTIINSGNINATISNASIAVTQSGVWSVTISNATLNITGTVSISSGTVNATISNASIAVTQSGSWSVTISNATLTITGTVAISSGNVNAQITNASITVVTNQNTTLSVATGLAAITTLSVVATPFPLVRGQRISLLSGANQQDVVLSQPAQAGATTLNVLSFTPIVNFPIGTFVLFALPIHLNVGAPSGNPATTLSAGFVAGQAKFTPVDPSIFAPGQIVTFNSLTNAAGNIGFVKSVNNDGTVTMTSNFLNPANAGDAVIIVQSVGILGQPTGVSSRTRGWDATGFSSPGAGNKAEVDFAAIVGKSYVMAFAEGEVVSTVAAADGATFDAGIAAPSIRAASGTEAIVGSTWTLSRQNIAINGGINTLVKANFVTAPQNASNVQMVSAACYIILGEPV